VSFGEALEDKDGEVMVFNKKCPNAIVALHPRRTVANRCLGATLSISSTDKAQASGRCGPAEDGCETTDVPRYANRGVLRFIWRA
jgi:hypothetical protein